MKLTQIRLSDIKPGADEEENKRNQQRSVPSLLRRRRGRDNDMRLGLRKNSSV